MKLLTILSCTLLLCAPSMANDGSRTLLRDALFAEESEQNYDAARKNYQVLLENYERERAIAATAMFRLAELSRKEGNDEEAAELYRRLLSTFPEADPQARMSRQNLIAMGEALPEATTTAILDEEGTELARLEKLRTDSPDLFFKTENLDNAASKGWLKVMAYLVESGANVNKGMALFKAAGAARLAACEFLLDNGCDPTIGKNQDAIKVAWQDGFTEVTKLLLARGSGVKGENGQWVTGWYNSKTELDQIKLIVDSGYDINFIGKMGSSAFGDSLLHRAARHNGVSHVEYLIKQGANVDAAGGNIGMTPLHIACNEGHHQVVGMLIKAGANLNAVTNEVKYMDEYSEATPMSLAINKSHTEVMLKLIDAGVEFPKEQFIKYAKYGYTARIPQLIEHGVDPNTKDSNGESAVVHALRENRTETAKLLIELGAKTDDEVWEVARTEMRTFLTRELIYPKLAERKGVTFVLPDLAWNVELTGENLDRATLHDALHTTPLPHMLRGGQNGRANDRYKASVSVRPNDVKLTLIRNGESTEITADGEVAQFQSGDIIELTGLFLPGSRWHTLTTDVSKKGAESPFLKSLRKALIADGEKSTNSGDDQSPKDESLREVINAIQNQ